MAGKNTSRRIDAVEEGLGSVKNDVETILSKITILEKIEQWEQQMENA